MLPSNVDPRRPDKVQRFTPKAGNGQEDLTPDYMNLLGQHQTTANAGEAPDKHSEAAVSAEPNLHANTPHEESHIDEHNNSVAVTTTATNVIPTSPQYGVAILPNSAITTAYLPTETVTSSTDTVTDTSAKHPDEGKDLHSTPSRNDRFKVVKIASLEPFKRGRWKCMDYVDEQPPQSSQSKVSQSTGNLQMGASGVFLQTQSMPQQQIHQYLLQGGFTNGTQFFPNVQSQMIPQNQYFYPQVTNMQTQTLQQQQVPSSMPAQFMNSNASYFPGGVVPNPSGFNVPQSFPNMQYVQGMIQNQSSAFVPTSQTVQLPANFQQSQTYAGQPNVSQSNVGQPLVNGHSFPSNEQVTSTSLPTQAAKSVILNSNIPQPVVSHPQINQTNVQNQLPMQNNSQGQSVPVIQSQQYQTATAFPQVQPQPQQNPNSNPVTVGLPNMAQVVQPQLIQGTHVVPVQSQNFDQSVASNVYTNPQFVMSGSATSLTNLENNEASTDAVTEPNSITEPVSDSADDPAKPNQVVNAIDNKIEQAMDLVKSHLMYTVREEVEVLKEKIAELMEKIQQLETENNFLKSQIPKTATTATTSNSSTINNQPPVTQSSKPSPNVIPNTQPVVLQNPSAESAPTQ